MMIVCGFQFAFQGASVHESQYPPHRRVGASITGGVGLGTVGVEISGGAGVEGDRTSSNAFSTRAVGNVTVSPVLPKVQAEIKINLIEFSVKPPVEQAK